MKHIGIVNVVLFHEKIIRETGGSEGVRDIGLVESAINRAHATFDGKDLYTEIENKVATTCYGLIKNHGFVDGNKRIGIAVMLLLLKMNRIFIEYTQEELIELGLGIADSKINEQDIMKWIRKHKIET